ncbi:MAG: M23 family metallopeptidase [Synergistaceae bacterium]|nr:M23 family metallopeptidase [Synergistaceae bacterium]
MATIVREGRPNWWAPIAANVIGGLLNRWQESERNKKANALMGEMAAQLQGFANGSQNTPQLTQAQSQGTGLLNPSMPESYNDNGWADAFHKTDTPLTQFDLGTAGATPSAVPSTVQVSPLGNSSNALANALAGANNPIAQYNTGVTGLLGANAGQSATQQRLPTPMDIYNVWANLVGSKRFRSVNPQTAQEILAPYLKMNEQARLEQRQKDLADAYMNAGSDTDKLNQMFSGAIQGIVPEAMLGRAQNRYQYDNPYSQPYTQNTGKTTRYGTFNPRTGEYTQAGEYDVTTTPAQDLAHQLDLMRLGQQQHQFDRTMEFNREGRAIQQDQWNRTFEQNNRPTYSIQAVNGKLYFADPHSQNLQPVMIDGKHADAPANANGANFELNEYDKTVLGNYDSQIKGKQDEIKRLETRRKDAYGQKLEEINSAQDKLKEEINQLYKAKEEYVANRMKQSFNNSGNSQSQQSNGNVQPQQEHKTKYPLSDTPNVALSMVGSTNRSEISNHYGAARPGGREHRGIDIAKPKGHPIAAPDIGTPLTVKSVGTDPHHSYGNHVVLTGTMTDGQGKKHTIEFTVAHMDNGSLNVKQGQQVNAGDLIGKVGNTGNTTDRSRKDKNGKATITNWYEGKNSGYHLHVETKIDGKHVNPEKFSELVSPYIAYTKTQTPNTFAGVTPEPKSTLDWRKKSTTVAYRNPKTGAEVSQADVEGTEQKAKNGKVDTIDPNGDISAQVHEHYLKRGFEPVTRAHVWDSKGQNASNDIEPSTLNGGSKFPITEQPTAQVDWRPSYMRGSIPSGVQPALQANVKVDPFDWRPSYMSGNVPSRALALSPSSTEMPTPSVQEEEAIQEALANLDGQYNTWDTTFRNRYPLDFWRV